MENILHVKNLKVSFRVKSLLRSITDRKTPSRIDAVKNVSLRINKGETFGLVGESGSGKTTLGRAVAGLVPIRSGFVNFHGERVSDYKGAQLKEYRKKCAMMFQDPVGSLSPRMNVGKLITEPYKIHGMKKEKDLTSEAKRLLEMVGLNIDFADRYPHQLSGGQARRVGVARALALNPELIIADEPTAGLDVSVQGEILNLLNTLKDKLGLSMLLITHNLSVVRHVCDSMAVMYLGRFVEKGPADEIFKNPGHPYTHALLSANPEPDPNKKRTGIELKGDVPSLLHRPSGCEFHTRCPFADEICFSVAGAKHETDSEHKFRCHFPLWKE